MNSQHLIKLIDAFQSGNITASEREELMSWYHSIAEQENEYPEEENTVKARMLYRLMEDSGYIKDDKRSLWRTAWSYSIAAVILIFIAFGIRTYYKSERVEVTNRIVTTKGYDYKAGTNSAQLILENGERVDLSSAHAGIQMGDHIKYLDGSQVSTDQVENPHAILTLQTPNAGQYQVSLEDGTKVWLNAGTTLKYPKQFEAKSRTVELEGEAYFEVEHNEKPFIVKTSKQQIYVLGTKFNVSNYSEQQVNKTTLLSGSVKIVTDQGISHLKPQQELAISTTGLQVSQVNAEDAIAWKNGLFLFDNETLESAMLKIAKWYNIKFTFKDGEMKKEKIFGLINRSENISVVIEKIESTGVAKFTIGKDGVEISKK